MLKSIYLQQVYSDLTARDPEQKEFHQAVREVLESLDLMIDSHPEYRGGRPAGAVRGAGACGGLPCPVDG